MLGSFVSASRRVGGVEDELRHLPVALVRVVEVVEGVEEPVLQRELAGVAGIRRDVGVHRRLGALRHATRPLLVVAAGVERVAGEVEVVLVAVVKIRGLRRDLDEVGAVPGTAQRDGRLVEEHVDVGRDVGLPRAALLRLVDEANDRGVARGEILLRPGERTAGQSQCSGEADRSNDRTRDPGHPHEANVFDGGTRCPAREERHDERALDRQRHERSLASTQACASAASPAPPQDWPSPVQVGA